MALPNDISETPRPSTGKPAWMYVVAAAIGPAVVLLAWFVLGLWSSPAPVPIRSGVMPFEHDEHGYAAPIPADWSVFEDASYPDRATLTPGQIRDRLGTCGLRCSAWSIVQLGDYPAQACGDDSCPAGSSDGGALTVYVFANPTALPLADFVEQALLKKTDGNHFYTVTFGDEEENMVRLEGLMERTFDEDANELRTYYFAGAERVFMLDQNVRLTDASAREATIYELQRLINNFELR